MTDPDNPEAFAAAVGAFKADLNAFRLGFPRSGYAALGKILAEGTYGSDAVVSSTTLNDATHPLKPLPTPRTVRAMVLALTAGDTAAAQEWVERRNRVESARTTTTDTDPRPPADDTETPLPPTTGHLSSPDHSHRRRTIAAAVVAVVVLLVASNAVTYVLAHRAPHMTPAQGRTGDNPLNTECTRDAKVAISTRANPAFLLEVIYSPACNAAWARITRTDDRDDGNEIRVTLYRRADPDGPTRQEAIEPDAHAAFTTMIVRSEPTDRLCAIGTVTTVAEPDATGRPLCL